MEQEVINIDGKVVGKVTLDEDIFSIEEREDVIHQVVLWQLAKRRAGTHKTKGISEISGTTKKPYSQKGTGRARQGSLRSAQFRGGAVIFGPVVRSHAFDLPKKIRKLGLKAALSAKLRSGSLKVINNLELGQSKTKDLKNKLNELGLKSVLIIEGNQVNESLKRCSRNLFKIDILPQIGANVYDIINHDNLLLTEEAVKLLQERLK
jgi:large subunit ribosomal protein L4